MRNIWKKALSCGALIAGALMMTGCLAGRYMCNYALLPEEHGNDIEGDRAKTEGRYPGILAWYDGLHEKGVFRDTTMTGENGYKLHAVYAPAEGPAIENKGDDPLAGFSEADKERLKKEMLAKMLSNREDKKK